MLPNRSSLAAPAKPLVAASSFDLSFLMLMLMLMRSDCRVLSDCVGLLSDCHLTVEHGHSAYDRGPIAACTRSAPTRCACRHTSHGSASAIRHQLPQCGGLRSSECGYADRGPGSNPVPPKSRQGIHWPAVPAQERWRRRTRLTSPLPAWSPIPTEWITAH